MTICRLFTWHCLRAARFINKYFQGILPMTLGRNFLVAEPYLAALKYPLKYAIELKARC